MGKAAPISGINPDAAPKAEIASLATSMTAAAFLGIAWYLCIELNVRLLVKVTQPSLYFWACLLCSWGIFVHCISILLSNFHLWTSYWSIVVIHVSWLTYVIFQSLVLYSRLSLVLFKARVGRYVLGMILVNAVVFGLSTVVFGLRHSRYAMGLTHAYLIWDRVQLAAFVVQETLIGILYIRETSRHLKSMVVLGSDHDTTRWNLRYLIAVNIFIIALDCSIMGLCYSGFFFLQGFYKAAVYAVKLRTEFAILNQLRASLPGAPRYGSDNVVGQHHSQDDGAMGILDILNEGREMQVVEDAVEAPRKRDSASKKAPADA
ncbi:uncharacterized protein SETTUDRAFT_153550 [Exserohilum turcica Et28A]|uniref:DUF7703 domain-containing protein n=1 Tax=Exserohilum turcicum (strain 28A) TaxID=671987 RepID=R0KBJ1_EXST2|nr:uncharacterized protein SETTUDRAFT_153550 [Exserohilum turcica Et28A]EOA86759.1 hypothetical protein SETTUDRAFT_153550 [Exserohilum turcica Et28A]